MSEGAADCFEMLVIKPMYELWVGNQIRLHEVLFIDVVALSGYE